MRDYSKIDKYLDDLKTDIYSQPVDSGHSKDAREVINYFQKNINNHKTVLDIGCGQGFCKPLFSRQLWTGITVGEDYQICKLNGLNVLEMDISFLTDIPDATYDLLFARHIFEHSPMPLLTLMEWYRVARYDLLLVAPSPANYLYYGINHYSVLLPQQIEWLASRAGWKSLEYKQTSTEIWFYFTKDKPRKLAPHYAVEYNNDEEERENNAK